MRPPIEQAQQLASCQEGLVTHVQLERAGFSDGQIRNLVRRRSRAVLPGVYLLDAAAHPGSWQELPLAVRVRAALLLHGPSTTVCLDTAARLRGIQGLGADDGDVQVQLPPGRERHQVPGVCIHTRLLDRRDVDHLGPVRLTSAQRTVLDVVLDCAAGDMTAPLVQRRNRAVRVLDSALSQRVILPSDLAPMRAAARGRRGAAICRLWWSLADGRAQSPLETDIRLIAIDADLPPDDLQVEVRDEHGVLLGLGDLGWELPGGRWLIAEADGAGPHGIPSALFRDRFRANDFAATGRIVLIRFTWADVRRPAYVVSQLRRHLSAAQAAS